MRLLGTILTACAVAAVIPYKITVNEEDGSVGAKALIYDLKISNNEEGGKKVNVSFFDDVKKAATAIKKKKEEKCCCKAEEEAPECECCGEECDLPGADAPEAEDAADEEV